MPPAPRQYNYAQADLAANQGATWRIVAIQRPPYSSTTANSSSKPVQLFLVPLFQAENVNLVLSGNSHNYERTVPLTNGSPAATGGITYVVSGAGGNGLNAFSGTAPAYSAFRESSYYQYAKVTVSPTALTVDAIRADTNAVFDTTTIAPSSGDTTAPTPPTVPAAGATTASTVPLSWTANPAGDAVTSYNVYRDSSKVGSSSGATFTDTGLTASSTYSYTVTALDAAGNESGPSTSASATTAAEGGHDRPAAGPGRRRHYRNLVDGDVQLRHGRRGSARPHCERLYRLDEPHHLRHRLWRQHLESGGGVHLRRPQLRR